MKPTDPKPRDGASATPLGRGNPIIQTLKRLAADKGFRRERGLFVCEGAKLAAEAAVRGASVRAVFVRDDYADAIPDGLEGAELYSCTERIMDAISPVKTPQGILLLCAIPPEKPVRDASGCVILDRLQDPGNVGTILRTADAFGIERVVFTEDCADPYGPKCVRGSMGAVFRNNFFTVPRAELPSFFSGVRLLAADAGGTLRLGETPLHGCAVIIGSEGEGVSPELRAACDGVVSIPISKGCESLNAAVAASVIMWEMRKC